MIPTMQKAKLPPHLSYPVGAEALTEGLADAPHAESFGVTFWHNPFWPRSRFRQALAQQQQYKILVAEYRPSQKPGYGRAQSLVNEKWQLTVYPVARELRHLSNRLLLERGLPLVVQWLRASQCAGWLFRDQRIELVFNPAEEALSAQESSGV
jgi:hypothetical protein